MKWGSKLTENPAAYNLKLYPTRRSILQADEEVMQKIIGRKKIKIFIVLISHI